MLSRKIVHQNVALLAGLAVLGTACLWGLLRLQGQVQVAVDEYTELRLLETAALHVSAGRGLAMSGNADAGALRRELAAAVDTLRRFERLQAEMREGSESHEEDEGRIARDVIARLDRVRSADPSAAAAPPAPPPAPLPELDAALAGINHLAGDADALVGKLQGRAARSVRNTIAALSAVFAAIVAAGVVISFRQYRAVMGPLNALREGVRNMASGSFATRLPEGGDRELADLAHEYNRMAEELDGLYRDLERKVADKSRELVRSERLASVGFLAAGVAHEINNPLNVISGYAELSLKRVRRARDEGALDDAERSLRIIREEAFRCKAITEKLLSLSKPGDGSREPLALDEVARDVVQMMSGHKRFADRRLVLRCEAPGPLAVRANEVEMKQVLLNLVVNALEATEPGRGEVRVNVERRDGSVELSVVDNGRGMDAEVRDHVFEPFFTARGPGGAKGTGLGLSISQAIVAGHEGRIRAESDGPGRGSRFTVQLPALAQQGASQGATR